jgi:pimeloyl-ACP methyl ester carboxylesterase
LSPVLLPLDDTGSGPPVVLLHAGVADRSMWDAQLQPLAEAGYRAIALDLPGFGEAEGGEHGQSPWVDVLETMDGLSIERAALVGNSFGGAMALCTTLSAPDRVSAIALFDAPPPDLDPTPELRAVWEAEEAALERGDIDAAVAAVVDGWTLPDAPQELRDRVAAMQRRVFDLQMEVDYDEDASNPLEDDPKALSELGIPALVAVGEFDKADFLDGANFYAAALGTDRVLIAGAGHLAPMETPAAVNELLIAFLDEL